MGEQTEFLVRTKFYKRDNRCYAVFFEKDGFTSYEVSQKVYLEFQKWVRKNMTRLIDKGVYASNEKTQARIKRMLLDHISFPY